jgi:hypothetical protein
MTTRKDYVFDHFLFTARRGQHPNAWTWEIRSKSKPDDRIFSASGFRSAKAAQESGKIVLSQIRESVLEERRRNPPAEPIKKIPKPRYIKRGPLPPERRSENARIAAHARAEALSPERRLEIARQGGEAAKAKLENKRKFPESH